MSISIAHISDTHLGREHFSARDPNAQHNQRGVDIVRAVGAATDQIIEMDPPLVIHSGDLFEQPNPATKYVLAAKAALRKLAGTRPDGTRRQVVVIAGNHDAVKDLTDGCVLDVISGFPGLHIVSSGFSKITFDTTDASVPPELADVEVHALPHDSLKNLPDMEPIGPTPNKINLLVTHGVAESTELYTRTVGREFHIPAELMLKDWNYVALGHFHKQGPVDPLGGNAKVSKIWYAGSTEIMGFGDLPKGEAADRGWLHVTVAHKESPVVTPVRFGTRKFVNLPPIQATTTLPDQIEKALLAAVAEASIEGAVVRQKVVDVPKDVWRLVNVAQVHDAVAGAALNYRIVPVYKTVDETGTEDDVAAHSSVRELISAYCATQIAEEHRDDVQAEALRLVGETLTATESVDATDTEATSQTAEAPVALEQLVTPATPTAPDVSSASPTPTEATQNTTATTESIEETEEEVEKPLTPEEADAARSSFMRQFNLQTANNTPEPEAAAS